MLFWLITRESSERLAVQGCKSSSLHNTDRSSTGYLTPSTHRKQSILMSSQQSYCKVAIILRDNQFNILPNYNMCFVSDAWLNTVYCVRCNQSSLSYVDLQWRVIGFELSFTGIVLKNSGSGASLQVRMQFHHQLRGYFGQVTQSLCLKLFNCKTGTPHSLIPQT